MHLYVHYVHVWFLAVSAAIRLSVHLSFHSSIHSLGIAMLEAKDTDPVGIQQLAVENASFRLRISRAEADWATTLWAARAAEWMCW